MDRLAELFSKIVGRVGQISIWLALILVLVQFFIVILRYIFGISFIEVQESVSIIHGILFMLAAGWVLQLDKHVRVDIFYSNWSYRAKLALNMVGAVFLLFPFVLVVWLYSWPYVAESWSVFEGSADTGLRVIYLQKTIILVFAFLLGMQGVSILLRGLIGDNKSAGEP